MLVARVWRLYAPYMLGWAYVRSDKYRVLALATWLRTGFFCENLWAGLLAKAARPFALTALITAFRRNTYS